MKTVGELLKTARIKKGLNPSQVADKTKIQEKFINALEADDFKSLPEAAFVKGFIRNYSQVVDKDPRVLLAIFRRDYSQDSKGKVIPRGLASPLNQPKLRWTPKTTALTAGVALLTLVAAYLVLQLRLLTGAPKLEIIEPKDSVVVSSLVRVAGVTHPQATITINSKPVEVGESGEFADTVDLTPGEHTITIVSTARSGKLKTLQRTVMVE